MLQVRYLSEFLRNDIISSSKKWETSLQDIKLVLDEVRPWIGFYWMLCTVLDEQQVIKFCMSPRFCVADEITATLRPEWWISRKKVDLDWQNLQALNLNEEQENE